MSTLLVIHLSTGVIQGSTPPS